MVFFSPSPALSKVKEFFEASTLQSEVDNLTLLPELERMKLKGQLGNCCKIIAVYHVHMLQTLQFNPQPKDKEDEKRIFRSMLPFYSHERSSSFSKPLMFQATKQLGSSVGELYSAKKITQLMKSNHIPCASREETTVEGYIDTLKKEIKEKQRSAIVFYDSGAEGRPEKLNSEREHAAVVVGYGEKGGIEHFVLIETGKYNVVNAQELAESALQLAKNREPETFYQIAFNKRNRWLTAGQINWYREAYDKMARESDNETWVNIARSNLKVVPTSYLDIPMKQTKQCGSGLRGVIITTLSEPDLSINMDNSDRETEFGFQASGSLSARL